MDKAINRYFVPSDYDLTLRLQRLFNETVALQTMLDNAKLKDERIKLASKLKEVHKEITLLAKEMKHLLSDTEIVKKSAPLTLSAFKRSN